MASSISFSGLGSGLDTAQIIEDLMSVDSQPLKRLESQKDEVDSQRDTFTSMKSDLLELKSKLMELKNETAFGLFSASSSDEDALGISASASASEGNYSLRILALAQAETLSGNSYEASDENLGITGEVMINGESFTVRASDTLNDIRSSINALDAGVQASVLKVNGNDYRLIITAESQGEDGFTIANIGSADTLGQLGFTDGTVSIRETSNGSVMSSGFSSANSTIASLSGFSSDAAGTVLIAGQEVDIDLSTDTLASIRDKINALDVPGVVAEVDKVTDENGDSQFKLAIQGTGSFDDNNHVLETLGILEGGTSGIAVQYGTSAVLYNRNGNTPAAENALFTTLGAEAGESITIQGTTADGEVVNETFTIGKNTMVSDLLGTIEEAFGGDVDASIDSDGRIVIEATSNGSSSLDVSLNAENELGGSLDFGTMMTLRAGRERMLMEGRDARIRVNNIEVQRSSNEISDVISGLSLTLKKADMDTDLNITVERDTESIIEKINDFITSYNEFISFVDEQSSYDQETGAAGPLLGDLTTRTTVSRLQRTIQASVFGDDFNFNRLSQVGVETTEDGTLKLNSSTLQEAMSEDMDSVISLFTASRSTTTNDVSFVYHSNQTRSGTYNFEITQAAEQARVVADSSLAKRADNDQLTITDNYGSVMSIDVSSDMSVSDIVNEINAEAEQTYTRVLAAQDGLETVSGGFIATDTAIEDIAGVSVETDDTITISATTKSGKRYQRQFTMTEESSLSIGDLLNAIESMNDYQVTASIDSNGRITVEDRNAGTSKIDLSISSTVKGLDFGTFDVTQEGRKSVSVSALINENGQLAIEHNSYGSTNYFSLSGGSSLGLSDGEYVGKDVAGTINGVEASGSGQTLTATDADEYTRGMVLRVTLTADEVAAQGSSKGQVTLVAGIADRLYSELSSLTDPVDGFIQAKLDSFDRTIDSMNDRIDNMNKRLELRREQYVRKYSALEKSLSQLNSLQQRLSASLASL